MHRNQVSYGAHVWQVGLVKFFTTVPQYDKHKDQPCWTLLSK